jgi:hypothetical protein
MLGQEAAKILNKSGLIIETNVIKSIYRKIESDL